MHGRLNNSAQRHALPAAHEPHAQRGPPAADHVDALGGTTHYRYDGLGNAILIRDAGKGDLTASYNALGDRLTMRYVT
jgi:YD repeat-containing protein